MRTLTIRLLDSDPESVSDQADMISELVQYNYRTKPSVRKFGVHIYTGWEDSSSIYILVYMYTEGTHVKNFHSRVV